MKRNVAFTLLEVIIVVIIIGVLTSLALPRFFKMIESTRAIEALANLAAIRGAYERLYMQHNRWDVPCLTSTEAIPDDEMFACLGLDNLENVPNAHFSYAMWIAPGSWGISAIRNTLENGTAGDEIWLYSDGARIRKLGTSAFVGVTDSP